MSKKLNLQIKKKNVLQKTTLFMLVMLIIVLFGTVGFAAIKPAQLSIELINQNPDPAISGDIIEVKLAISNVGGEDANNVIISLAKN